MYLIFLAYTYQQLQMKLSFYWKVFFFPVLSTFMLTRSPDSSRRYATHLTWTNGEIEPLRKTFFLLNTWPQSRHLFWTAAHAPLEDSTVTTIR